MVFESVVSYPSYSVGQGTEPDSMASIVVEDVVTLWEK